MTAKQLKNSILQEAIMGRLVPQDPNDEPASVLLDKIREEKKRLVKEGKLKKKDLEETPISEDERPFEIPDSWEWVKFGNIISLLSGRDLTPQEYSDKEGGIPYITGASNFDSNSLIINRWTTKPVCISKYGDLLITCKGTIGTMAFNQIGDIHIARQVMAISPYTADIKYIKYFLMRIVYELDKKAKSIIPGISREDVQNAKFPLPPLAEQKRIVSKIEELLPKVEEYGKAQESLDKLNEELPERLKKSILQEAIEGRLVPQDPNDEPASVLLDKIRAEKKRLVKEGKLKKKDLEETPVFDDEIPFDIPDNWIWCKLGTIAAVLGGKRIPAGRKLSIENTGHIYIRVSDMKGNSVSTDNLQYVPEDIFPSISKYIINKEDVYITVAGTIGKIGKIPSELDGANLTENADRLVFSHLNQDWLIKCLESNVVQAQITGVTTKVGQPKLAILRIQTLLIPLPPLAEQKRIVEKIEALFVEIDNIKIQ